MYLFAALCLLALLPSILAAEPPQALQPRDPANMPRQILSYDGKDLKDLIPAKDSDKDKDKPSNLTATVTTSFAPIVIPSKDLPSSTTIGSDKDKTKDDKTYQASSSPSSAPPLTPSKDLPSSTTTSSDKDKAKDDKTSSAASTRSFTPTGFPTKDLPSFTTIKSDKAKSKDDRTSTALSGSLFAPIVVPSKDLPSSTTNGTDKDKTKDDKTYQASSTPSSAPVVLPSKDLPSSTTKGTDKDKTKDDKTFTAASTPSFPVNNNASMPDKDKDKPKDSSTTPLKDKTSSMTPSKDMSSENDSLTITNLASLTLSLISPATTPPNSTFSAGSSALLTPPMIMYTVTLKPEKPSSTLLSSKTELSLTGTGLPPFSSQPSMTSGFGSTIFPGYSVVPSPSESGTKAEKGSLTDLSSATIPVWTPAMLGNAYGGGFVTTPSIFVTRLPFPSGPPGNVPPGYGVPSKSEISTLTTAAPGNQTPVVTSVNGSIFASDSTEGVKSTLPPYQNVTGVPENGPSTSIFAIVSSQPKSPEGPGGAKSSITSSLVPTESKSEETKPLLALTSSSPSSQSAVLYSMSFGFKTQSAILGGGSSPSLVQSDKSVPKSGEIGGKPEASESTGFDTKSSSNVASGELPTASSAAALQSSQLGLSDTTLPLVQSTSLKPGSALPLLSTPSFASGAAQQYPSPFQLASASPSIASSVEELVGTTLSLLPTPTFASSFGTLEGQTIPIVATPSLGKVVGGSVPQVQTTSLQSSLGGHVGSTAPLEQTPSITSKLGNGVAGMTLSSSPTLSLGSSLGNELAGTTLPLVPTSSFASTLGNGVAGTPPPSVPTPGSATTLENENAGTTLPLVPTSSFASTLGDEVSGTIPPDVSALGFATSSGELGEISLPLMPTPSLASTLENQFSGTTLPLVPTPSLVSSLGELVGTSLPFMSKPSLGNELGGTALPSVASPSLLSTLESDSAGATQPLVPMPSSGFSSGEVVDKTAPIASTSASALAGVKPEGLTSVPTKTGEEVTPESTFTSALAGLKLESHGPVPTVSANEVAAGSTSTSALAGLKPEGSRSVPTMSGKDIKVKSASASALAGIKSEGPMLVPTVTGNGAGGESTAAPTEGLGSGTKASISLSPGEIPKQATEGVVPLASDTTAAQQSASMVPYSGLGGGDSKSDTSISFGGEQATVATSVSPSTSSLFTMGGVTGVTPNPAAESGMAKSAIGTLGSVSGVAGPQSNASIAFNVTPSAIQYFEGSAAHVTWSFAVTLITFLAFLLWL